MAEDGEDQNRLEMTILKSVATFFKIQERQRSSFNFQAPITLSLSTIGKFPARSVIIGLNIIAFVTSLSLVTY